MIIWQGMNTIELARFERRWTMDLAAFGAGTIVVFAYLVAFAPQGHAAWWCCVLGGTTIARCLFAAHRLGNPERLRAPFDGDILLAEPICPIDLGDIDHRWCW